VKKFDDTLNRFDRIYRQTQILRQHSPRYAWHRTAKRSMAYRNWCCIKYKTKCRETENHEYAWRDTNRFDSIKNTRNSETLCFAPTEKMNTNRLIILFSSLHLRFGTPPLHYLRGVNSDTTQLNSTDPDEQRTAKSVVFLFMTSRPTNWVNCCSRCRIEFSWVVSV